MEPIQIVILVASAALGYFFASAIMPKRREEYLWYVGLFFFLYLATPVGLGVLQVGSLLFMGISFTIIFKSMLLGAVVTVTANRIR